MRWEFFVSNFLWKQQQNKKRIYVNISNMSKSPTKMPTKIPSEILEKKNVIVLIQTQNG
jgi:hypothetical protein